MNLVIWIILLVFFFSAVAYLIPRIINFFLIRKLHQLPEIERKLMEGEYSVFNAVRAQYLLDYFESRGIYFPTYNQEVENNE
jgi:branched-subunit amino acid transport protein